MKAIKLPITTDSSGAGTATSDITDPNNGFVYAVQLVDGTFADGVDVTVTFEQGDVSIPVLVKADWNTDQMIYPRVAQALNTDGSALTTHAFPVAYGQAKAVIAQGGDVASGSVIIYVLEDR
jgi:hypothetical protein